MSDKKPVGTAPPSPAVTSFIDQLARLPTVRPVEPKARLMFAMDATASREATWREAKRIQADMFDIATRCGGLEIQLCHYQGMAEFRTSAWLGDTGALRREMEHVTCVGGLTQIGRVLNHALQLARSGKLNALVFIGDCVEENADALCRMAGELGLLNVKAFMFQEGSDKAAQLAFQQIAKLSGGAYSRFDSGSARTLADLLGAVAAYAAGGMTALEQFGAERGGAALQLNHQLKKA